MLIRIADHLEEIVHRLMGLDLALGQSLHAVHKAIPLAHSYAQLALDRLGMKGRAVRDFDGTDTITQCNG